MTKTNYCLTALLVLSASLRAARTAEGLGLRHLARKLGVSAQLLSLWETGKRSPAVEDTAHLLGYLRVNPREYHRIMQLRYQIDNPIAVETLSTGSTGQLHAIQEISIRTFEWAPQVVPEPLQTPEYIKAIWQGPASSPDDLDLAVFAHQIRQLERTRPSHETFLLGVEALAPAAVPQLQALRSTANEPTLKVRIVRPSRPAAETIEPFTIYEVAKDVFTVALRHQDNIFLVSETDTVQRYRSTFKALERNSITPRDYQPDEAP